MGKGKVIAIVIPSVLAVGIGTIALVSYFQNKNKYKVSEAQWKETFSSYFNYEKRNFRFITNDTKEWQTCLDVIDGKERYDSNTGGEDQYSYKYKKGDNVYIWNKEAASPDWVKTTNTFTEDKQFCGLGYLKGIENNFKDFTFNDGTYKGKYLDVDLEIKFYKDKTIDSILYKPDGSSVVGSITISKDIANIEGFPSKEPASI